MRAPPVKSVADFFMYLFQDRKLQPSTIDGYRSAIADKLGNSRINISKHDNLTCLLHSFHRDRPKGQRGIPSWNLSLVLHQLTKAPFEPIKEASLKHLTFKTVFLLALGSGKRRSEIHAWQNKNIRPQSDWSKVSLYPSPSFLSKNQLAKEGPGSVAPVVIPALAQLWISPSSLTGPSVRSEHCTTIWTGPQIEQEVGLCLLYERLRQRHLTCHSGYEIKPKYFQDHRTDNVPKFSTHRVSEQCTLGNFQKIFLFPKMAAILNFRIFCQKWQNTNLLLSP